MSFPQTFPNYDLYSEYNLGGFNFGNPLINGIINPFIGNNYMPRPESGQSMQEAFIQRERTAQMNQMRAGQFMNNRLFQSMGISGNPMLSAVANLQAVSGPDSQFNKLLSPLGGGNPVAASMQLYSGLAGANVMGNFGRTGSITAEETKSTMQALMDSSYKIQSKEEATKELRNSTQDFLKKQTPKVLTDLGLDTKQQADVSSGKFDITDEAVRKPIQDKYNQRLEKISMFETAMTKYENRKQKDGKLLAEIEKEVENTFYKPTEFKGKKTVYDPELAQAARTAGPFAPAPYKNTPEYDAYLKEEEARKKRLEGLKTGGKLDFDKVRAEFDKSKQQTELEKRAFKDPKENYREIDYANTRGYKTEDFASAFTKGVQLRMISGEEVDENGNAVRDSQGRIVRKTPAKAMKDFMGGGKGGEFMDAAKSLFGDKSGGELMQDASRLVGKEGMGDLSKVSKLMRDVKSTARVAGVSLNAMFSIIESANELAQSNPQLQGIKRSTITDMAIRNVKDAATMSMGMTSAEFRSAGGEQQIAANLIKEDANYAQSSKASLIAVAAMRAYQKGPKAFDEFKAAYESGQFSGNNLEKGGLAEMARITGASEAQLIAGADPSNAALAQQAKKIKGVGELLTSEAARNDRLREIFDAQEPGRYSTTDPAERTESAIVERIKKAKKEGKSGDDIIREEFLMANEDNPFAQELALNNPELLRKFVAEVGMDPEQKKMINARVAKQSEQQEEFSKKYSKARAGLAAQAFDLISSKSYAGGKVIEDITSIFSTAPVTGKKYEEMSYEEQAAYDFQKNQNLKVANANKGMLDKLGKVAGNTVAEKDANLLKDKEFGQQMKDMLDAEKERLAASDNAADRAKAAGMGFNSADEATEAIKNLKDNANLLKNNDYRLGTAEDRKNQLKTLPADDPLRKALENAQKLGVLDDDDAFKRLYSGTVGGTVAATTEAAVSARKKEDTREIKKFKYENINDMLATEAERDQKSPLNNILTSLEKDLALPENEGKTVAELAIEKWSKRDDPNDQNNPFQNLSKDEINNVKDSMDAATEQAEQPIPEGGQAPGGQQQENPIEQLKSLFTSVFGTGSMDTLATQVGEIASALGRLIPGK